MNTLQARSEATIQAPVAAIWAIITDIAFLPKINPGVIKASGNMDDLNATRTCEIVNKGRKGSITERLVEFIPGKKTVWLVESDSMGMSKMLRDIQFILVLENFTDSMTRVTAETHYTPANFFARIMNRMMMRRMMAGAQQHILQNIRSLTEK